MRRNATCSTRARTEEEHANEREADSAKAKADEVRPMTTPNFGRKTEAIEEPSEEGGASILARADKTQPNADIAENSATTKKKRESASTSLQLTNYAHNSDYEDYRGMYRHNSN